jgi:hypothetical protein
MQFLLTFLLIFVFLPVTGQQRLVMEKIATGRLKEIRAGNRIRIYFTSWQENAKVYQTGKVLAITDSTISYFPATRREGPVTVALNQINSIGKYNAAGSVLMALSAGAAGGFAWAALESGEERNNPTRGLLAFAGASLLYNGLEALIYPRLHVNRPDARWRIKSVP